MRRRSRLRGRRYSERLFCRSGWGRRRAQKTWCSKALVKKMKGKEQKGERDTRNERDRVAGRERDKDGDQDTETEIQREMRR